MLLSLFGLFCWNHAVTRCWRIIFTHFLFSIQHTLPLVGAELRPAQKSEIRRHLIQIQRLHLSLCCSMSQYAEIGVAEELFVFPSFTSVELDPSGFIEVQLEV